MVGVQPRWLYPNRQTRINFLQMGLIPISTSPSNARHCSPSDRVLHRSCICLRQTVGHDPNLPETGLAFAVKMPGETSKITDLNRAAHRLHQRLVIMQVMQGI